MADRRFNEGDSKQRPEAFVDWLNVTALLEQVNNGGIRWTLYVLSKN